MTTIQIALPDDVFVALRKGPDEVARDVRLAAAVDWYALGACSQGKAAELAGVSRSEFLDELVRRKVDVIRMTPDDLEADLGGR